MQGALQRGTFNPPCPVVSKMHDWAALRHCWQTRTGAARTQLVPPPTHRAEVGLQECCEHAAQCLRVQRPPLLAHVAAGSGWGGAVRGGAEDVVPESWPPCAVIARST